MVISHNTPSGGASTNVSNGKRTKPRTSITPQQLEILKQAYLREQRPTKQTREELMAKTGLDMKVCKCTCTHVRMSYLLQRIDGCISWVFGAWI